MNDQLNRMKQSQLDTRKMLAEWRENNFHEVQLPLSGRVLQVRDVGLIDLVIEGKVPNTMLDMVEQVNDGRITQAQLLMEHSREFGELVNMIFMLAVISPPVAEEPDADHVSPKDFVYGDKVALFNWVNREAVIVRPFRQGPPESVEVLPDGQDVSGTTE